MKITTLIITLFLSLTLTAQSKDNIVIDIDAKHQTIEGFGAALAFYENWLTAHPHKAEIYEAIFNELSLDILRVRNAYDYDPGMIDRVVEFYSAAEESLGHPIKLLSTSWGPPAYLKSNNDKNNGGTLKYTVNGSTVEFDYDGFAEWWDAALNEYESNGIVADYISIQNEPDYLATWESCLFKPTETITATDTIAGYNKALEKVYNLVSQRESKPKFLGPETIGIGYNSVQNYVNALNTSHLYGIAHHLYHGVDEYDPWASDEFNRVGNLNPEIPHFQTEYGEGDWFSLAGLMYKTFHDENAVAYLYWDLIWTGGGLVSLDNPWNEDQWTSEKGYVRTKDFYAFKQFSAFIHPNWTRVSVSNTNANIKTLAFINPELSLVTLVLVNHASDEDITVSLSENNLSSDITSAYRTSENDNFLRLTTLEASNIVLPKESITTLQLSLGVASVLDVNQKIKHISVFPNPTSDFLTVKLPEVDYKLISIYDIRGKLVKQYSRNDTLSENKESLILNCRSLQEGLYILNIETRNKQQSLVAKFVVKGK